LDMTTWWKREVFPVNAQAGHCNVGRSCLLLGRDVIADFVHYISGTVIVGSQ
jgi:hypothetical protein